ncbi:metal-response element-binding transcription factor 2, partial [Aplysia californica]|uniref:Metal-response element-binding transcription factor 2 n=1 Tax=Aplysia californica TaxID=6500 RepID=A0ABM1AET5_APLCA
MNLKRFRTIWKKSQVRKDMKPKKSEVRKPRLAPLKQAGREKALARWSDGLFYIVNIVQISEAKKKCVVQFEDKSIASVQLKDVLKEKEGDDPCCHMCGVYEDSLASLVECNNCERAYHKKCHQPPIAASAVDDFVCRICVFASCAQPGGAKKTGALVEKFKEMKRTLPYDERYLVWDASHVSNVEHSYCYCGGPGHWYNKMLQCCRCRQWFHEACIHCMEEELLIGDRFYIFACSRCNEEEFLLRMDLSWLDVACVSLFHLSMTLGSRYVDLEERLLPFIKAKSHSFGLKRLLMDNCVGPGRQGLLLAIRQEMMKVLTRSSVFCCGQEVKKKNTWFGLRDRIPPTPPPHCVPLNDLVASHVYDKLYAGKTALFTPVKFNSPVPYVYKGAHKVTPPTLGARLKESKMAKLARLKSEHNYCSLSSDYDAEPPVLTPIDRLSPVPKMFEEFDRNNNSPVKCEKVSGDEDDGEEEEE